MTTKSILASLGLTASVLICGTNLASAAMVQSVLTDPVSGVDGSDFFVGNAPLDKLPYELAVVRSTATQTPVKSSTDELNAAYYSVFQKLNIVPELVVLAIDGAKFQRELGTATILDGAYRAGTVYGPVASDFTLHYETASANLMMDLDDASLSALSAVVDEDAAAEEKNTASAATGDSVAAPAEAFVANIETSMNGESAGFEEPTADSAEVGVTAQADVTNTVSGQVGGASGSASALSSGQASSDSSGTSKATARRTTQVASSENGATTNSLRRLRSNTIQGLRLRPMSLESDGNNAERPVSSVPLPAALPLLASALAGFGFISRRRKNVKA